MPLDPDVKLRKLLTDVLTTQAPHTARADAAETAAVRLAKRMLASDHKFTFKPKGFVCDEPRYGDGAASYLTNAQGLVGVLLPLVEVEWSTPSPQELERILKAADDVVRHANRPADIDVWFSLLPYVGEGPIRKAFPDRISDFYSTNGVAWTLSSLVLLYLCHLLGKVELSGKVKPADVVTGIETCYGLLLRAYLPQKDGRAGWSWCSLVDTPDLYHTWSVSQTLGDLEDYVFTPDPQAPYAVDPALDKLARKLRESTPPNFLGGNAKTATDTIYREACQWLYTELTSDNSPAVREEMSDVNAPENDIYYSFFLIEALVYMHADEILPQVMHVKADEVLDTMYEKMLVASNRLRKLRETPWYESADRSTLAVPLPVPTGEKIADQILEPSLEPLVLRALSYGPVYLKKIDILAFVDAALSRHAGMLNDQLELWDEKKPNFLICERTVEALVMVRNMYRKTMVVPIPPPEPDDPGGGLTLTLSTDQVKTLVDSVIERLRDRVSTQVAATFEEQRKKQPSHDHVARASADGDDIVHAIDPLQYKDIARPEKILLYLDEKVGQASEAVVYQTMLLETIVALLTALFQRVRPAADDEDAKLPSYQLADGLARAIGAILPRAIAYYLDDRIDRLSTDNEELRGKFDGRRIEEQIERLALVYVEKEFKQREALDVAGGLAETLQGLRRRGGDLG